MATTLDTPITYGHALAEHLYPRGGMARTHCPGCRRPVLAGNDTCGAHMCRLALARARKLANSMVDLGYAVRSFIMRRSGPPVRRCTATADGVCSPYEGGNGWRCRRCGQVVEAPPQERLCPCGHRPGCTCIHCRAGCYGTGRFA